MSTNDTLEKNGEYVNNENNSPNSNIDNKEKNRKNSKRKPKANIIIHLKDFIKYDVYEKNIIKLETKSKSPSPKIKNNFNQNKNNNEKKDFMHLIDKYTQPNKCAKDLIHNKFYEKKK